MAISSYNESLTRLLAHEGGYTNDAADPGGPTNWGITIYDARMYWKPGATAADVRKMPLSVAKDIYKQKYWDALRCSELPAGIDDSVFDYGVNSGIGRSGRVLRKILGLSTNDWHVTDAVMAELSKHDRASVVSAINAERLRFLQGLHTWSTFGNGWSRRVREVLAFDLKLAAADPPIVPAKDHIPAPGKSGHRISDTQSAMNELGISLRVLGRNLLVDGIKGPNTDTVVEAYQTEKGLVVDSIAGVETWAAIEEDLGNLKESA